MTSTWLNLAGRKAVITGAASGIGSAVARTLALQGCSVICSDVDIDGMLLMSESLLCNDAVHIVPCDVRDIHQVQHLMEVADVDHSASILVNCAGVTRDATIDKMDVGLDYDLVMDVNLKGTFLTCKYFASKERLLKLDSGVSIVNLSSIVGDRGNFGQTNYAASKAGVIGLTKALAKEIGRHNGRVNAILPGFIDTRMTAAVPDHVKENMKKKIALGRRFGSVDDVADLVAFLASDRSGYITGTCIECSGGISL